VLQGTTVSESNVSWFTDTYFPAPGYEDVTAAESYTSLGSPSPGALAPPTHAAIFHFDNADGPEGFFSSSLADGLR
jgi:hypothetical protein